MTDALLLARIGSLYENLTRVDESLKRIKAWQTQLELAGPPEERVANDLWHTLDFEVRRKFEIERRELESLREALENGNGTASAPTATSASVQNPWARYAEVRDESERLFDECLEFIGALAFRRTGVDEQHICQLADGLILACALEAYAQRWNFLTVPSLRAVVTKSRLRLSRIRFPEWTVWTLPATAYVLGHEVMTAQAVAELVSEQMDSWARRDVAPMHVPALIAEVFAAYLMGPAYGHAAIRLRFDPSQAYEEDDQRPAEASRAHVVLATLERMAARESEAVWASQVGELRDQWSRAIIAAAPDGSPPDAPASLDELVEEAVEHFGFALNINAQYGATAWRTAERLYARWRDEAEASMALDALTSEPAESLLSARDVLNAAWLMRIDRPADIARTEIAAMAMCRRVLVMRETGGGGPGQAPIPSD